MENERTTDDREGLEKRAVLSKGWRVVEHGGRSQPAVAAVSMGFE